MASEGQVEHVLNYSLSEKGAFLVISLTGRITNHTAPVLERCQQEALGRKATQVVLHLQGVDDVYINGLPALVKLQSALRQKGAALRISGMNRMVRLTLQVKAAVRDEEVATTLQEALQSFG